MFHEHTGFVCSRRTAELELYRNEVDEAKGKITVFEIYGNRANISPQK